MAAGSSTAKPGVSVAAKRGPKTRLDDTALLAHLAATPFKGEGHRRVWARLRYVDGHLVARNRVPRLIAPASFAFASPHPHRARQGP